MPWAFWHSTARWKGDNSLRGKGSAPKRAFSQRLSPSVLSSLNQPGAALEEKVPGAGAGDADGFLVVDFHFDGLHTVAST